LVSKINSVVANDVDTAITLVIIITAKQNTYFLAAFMSISQIVFWD